MIVNGAHNLYNLDTNNKGLRYMRRLAYREITGSAKFESPVENKEG
jgi:hypothetical protein